MTASWEVGVLPPGDGVDTINRQFQYLGGELEKYMSEVFSVFFLCLTCGFLPTAIYVYGCIYIHLVVWWF